MALNEFITNDFKVNEAKPTAPAGPPAIDAMNAVDLANTEFMPLVEVVKGLIVEGCTLFAGASKIGKSWGMLQLGAAVAAGEPVWGRATTKGAVLYLAFEDSARRLQYRLNQMGIEPNENLNFYTKAITLAGGLVNALEEWIQAHANARLVIVDTLQKARGPAPARANAYAIDYEFISPLKALADKYHVAVVLVHHLNKLRDVEDPFDRISGSTGLMGAADTTILITRNRGEETAKVTFTGRDVWGDDFEMRFENCRWHVCDPAALARERYENAAAVKAVKLYMAQGSFDPIRRVTFDDLGRFASENSLYIGIRPQEVRKAVEPFAEPLERYDGIRVEYCERVSGKSGRGFTMRRVRG
ncbi:MAG: AAA family ATPase [Oscillospiraceae bacterium]|nr:AAA family ATPase [Oscillospiraceae bacterium]